MISSYDGKYTTPSFARENDRLCRGRTSTPSVPRLLGVPCPQAGRLFSPHRVEGYYALGGVEVAVIEQITNPWSDVGSSSMSGLDFAANSDSADSKYANSSVRPVPGYWPGRPRPTGAIAHVGGNDAWRIV